MHTVVALSDGTFKVMFVAEGDMWNNVMFNLNAEQAVAMCNILNGGPAGNDELIEQVATKFSVTQINGTAPAPVKPKKNKKNKHK